MSPLDEAATALRKEVETLDLEGMEARFEERTEALRTRRQALERCWDGLGVALAALVTRIEEESGELHAACERAATALTGLMDPLQEGAESMEDAVELAAEAAQGLAAVVVPLGEVLPPALMEQALDPANMLMMATEELASATIESLDTVANLIGAGFLKVTENSEAMARLNVDSLGKAGNAVATALAGDFEDWARRMRHAVEHVEEGGYKPACLHGDAAVDTTLAECRTDQKPAFDEVTSALQASSEATSQLSTTLKQVLPAVPERLTSMASAGSDVAEALTEARPALAAVREFVAANGFGPA